MSIIQRLDELSFPDCDVLEMRLDHGSRRISFVMSGAWIPAGSIASGDLIISDWETFRQRRYDLTRGGWVDTPIGQEEPLKDIPEFLVEGNEIVLRGFGAISGEWVEIATVGGQGLYRIRE